MEVCVSSQHAPQQRVSDMSEAEVRRNSLSSSDADAPAMRLSGKVAIVTGAGGGIGRAESLLLAHQGAMVVANSFGRDETGRPRAEGILEEIAAFGGTAITTREDLEDEGAAKRIVDTAIGEFGRLDVLINNAGRSVVSPVREMSGDDWDSVMAVNLRASFLLCKYATPYFADQRSGVIINTGSTSGLGHAYMSNYAAAKEGLIGFTRSLARELGPLGVRCNAVRPKAFGTGLGAQYTKQMEPWREQWESLGRYRVGDQADARGVRGPSEVAPMVVWLCTDAAANINGQTFAVEGERVGIWSEPEIYRSVVRSGGWDLDSLDSQIGSLLTFDLENHFGASVEGSGNES